jgi:HrpA-like RNA helicase
MSGRAFKSFAYVCLLTRSPPKADLLISRTPRTASRLVPLALHAGLPTDEQLRVFEQSEPGHRKVIVSTNIAEVNIK